MLRMTRLVNDLSDLNQVHETTRYAMAQLLERMR